MRASEPVITNAGETGREGGENSKTKPEQREFSDREVPGWPRISCRQPWGEQGVCSCWMDISVTPAGNASTSAPRATAGDGATHGTLRARELAWACRHQGGGKRCRPGRPAWVCGVCSHPGQSVEPVVVSLDFQMLNIQGSTAFSRREQPWGRPPSVVGWWGYLLKELGRQHRWDRGATCPSVLSRLFLELTLPGPRQAGSPPDLLGTSNRTIPKSGS